MSSAEKYGIAKFDEHRYSQIIVDFILNNPGCIADYILENESKIGRRRLFTVLNKLKRKKVIIEKKKHPRARDVKLYVNGDNPLCIVSEELREFEKLYPNLLNKLKEEHKGWQSGKWPPYEDASEIIYDTTLLLFDTMRLFTFRSAMVWSRTIKDKYTKELLNFIIFSKLHQIQIKISETLDDVTLDGQDSFIPSVVTEIEEIETRIHDASRIWDSYEIKKEMELISNFASKIITTEMARLRIYSLRSKYRWKIDLNDAEELAKDMTRDFNTRSTIADHYDTYMGMQFDQIERSEERV